MVSRWDADRIKKIRKRIESNYTIGGHPSAREYSIDDVKFLMGKLDEATAALQKSRDAAMEVHGAYMTDELVAETDCALESLRKSAEAHRIVWGVEAFLVESISEDAG